MNRKTVATFILVALAISSLVFLIPSDEVAAVEDTGTVSLTASDGTVTEGLSFSSAANMAASGDGYTITLESDVTLNNACGSTYTSGFWKITNSVILDMGPWDLIINSNVAPAIFIYGDSSNLTIRGTGTLTGEGSSTRVIFCSFGSTLEIDGVTVKATGSDYPVYLNGSDTSHAKLTLRSGSIEAQSIHAIYSNRGDIHMVGGEVSSSRTDGNAIQILNSTAVINIEGGTINGGIHNNNSAPVVWSGGAISGNIGLDTIVVPENRYLVVSGNSGGYATQFSESEPSQGVTAILGNMYFTTTDGPQLALDCMGLMTDLTFYSVPSGGITFTLDNVGDTASVLLLGDAVNASVVVNAGTGCKINESQADDGKTIYTATLDPELAEVSIGDTYYATFEEAVAAVQNGQTIRLCKDVVLETRLPVSCDYTLDLYGYDLTLPSSSYGGQINAHTLTIQDTSLTYSLEYDESNKTVSYVGGSIIYQGDDDNGTFYLINNKAVLNLLSGCIQADNRGVVILLGTFNMSGGYISAGDAIIVLGGEMETHVGDVSITGGIIEASIAIQGNGSTAYGNTDIDISDAVILCDGNGSFTYAIYHPQKGTLDISNSKIICNDGAGIVARAGAISINNSTITTTGNLTGTAGDGSNIISSSALVYDLQAGYPGLSAGYSTDVSGVTFSSDAGVDAISCLEGTGDNAISVISGTFSSDVSNFVADRYSSIKQEDGTWGVMKVFESGDGSEGDPYVILDEDQFRAFRDSVNSGMSYEGMFITLGASLNLENEEWIPIGVGKRSSGTLSGDVFRGTFNGGGYEISNLTISQHASEGVGLFSFLIGGSITNLTMSGVSITTSQESTGALVGAMSEGATISNVKVLSGSIQGNQGVGGIVGRIISVGSVEGCTNDASVKGVNVTISEGKIEYGYNVGGIVGAAYYKPSGEGMTISRCTNSGAVDSPTVCSGGIVGLSMGTVENCTNSGVVTGGGCSIGGIVGEQQNYGTISGCKNLVDGKVSNTSTEPGSDEDNPSRTGGMGTGGIVGWVRYSGPETTYTGKTTISVIDCSNAAPVSTQSTHAGGIIGAVYHSVVMTGCSNTGLVSSSSFAGGLIGGMQTLDVYHPTDGCRLVLTGNSSTVSIGTGESTTGWAIGHFSSATDSSNQNCNIPNGSNWTVYGNLYNGDEIPIAGIQSVVTVTDDDGTVYGYPSRGC